MLFNSIDFAIFLPAVFIIYWFALGGKIKLQNTFLAIASYVFYGFWDWRFLLLIFLSSTVDYTVGRLLKSNENCTRRKILLWTSISFNISLLGFFKYYNFFVDSFVSTFTFFGQDIQDNTLDIILPIGISFYTFQTLSYTIDTYNRKLVPTTDFVAFSTFVSFFPQLVAGPIERATHLLPQFLKKRTFNYLTAVDGLRQILWGLFKKIVIADNCAVFANEIFNNAGDMNSSALILGPIFFAFQIYGDFSGYSDIAIGTSRLFGFNLSRNFNFPYFSRDIAEFWRKWHISLSTWFRDYLYIPLGGSRSSTFKKVRNVFIIFIVSGLWHGANWTFVAWGLLHSIYFLPLLLLNRNRNNTDVISNEKLIPSLKVLISMGLTFGLTTFAWIFFRAESLKGAFTYVSQMLSRSPFETPNLFNLKKAGLTLFLMVVFIGVEWLGRKDQYATEKLGLTWKPVYRYFIYYAIVVAIIFLSTGQQEFIYFQF
ncbi:MAG: alginate O-acetyltransferase complex protein AlgI [Glaciecola sp.]|jgi:alginate O-acetyltransferase complex protein AlgI